VSETIVAIATANGVGSIAIVRLSGDDALNVAKKLTKDIDLPPRYAKLSKIYSTSGEFLDEAILIYFKAPHSFSGEDIVEFQCHGGYIVASLVLKACIDAGARLAEAGEFSKRAFLNGKIDLSRAEAIAALIEARSSDAQRVLARQLTGELSDFVDALRDELVLLLAHSEVVIDYAEEDLPSDLVLSIETKLAQSATKLDSIVRSSLAREGLMQGFKVAIVGKPNVGKSSLLNQLLNRQRAIVSSVAGTTRDTLEEQLRIGSHLVRIVDTAGIRDASDEIETIGIERSLESIKECDIVVALFDSSRIYDAEDEKVLEHIDEFAKQKSVIYVKNKTDLPPCFDGMLDFDLELNSKKDASALVKKLESIMDLSNDSEEIMLISQRQIESVQNCSSHLQDAILPIRDGELEIFSYHLLEAIKALTSITKGYDNEEMLDKMFGSFCLGK